MQVANKIETLRKLFSIKNNKKLAEKVNIPYTTLLTICKGETDDIKLSTAQKLCEFFDLTLDELLDDNYNLPEYILENNVIKRKYPRPMFSEKIQKDVRALKFVSNIDSNNLLDLSDFTEEEKELIFKIIELNKKNKNNKG